MKIPVFKRYLLAQSVTICSGLIFVQLDKIRLKLQLDKKAYTVIIDCGMKTYQQEGLFGFYRGGLNIVHLSLGGALVSVIYDEIRKRIKN